MVVLTAGVAVAIDPLGFPIVVVVVVTERAGSDGGGAETTCDSGSEAQPARRPRAPQQAKNCVRSLAARTEIDWDKRLKMFIFIFQKIHANPFRHHGVFYVAMRAVPPPFRLLT
jgi:hypothetical protein